MTLMQIHTKTLMQSNFSRRFMLGGMVSSAALIAVARPSFAMNEGQAKTLVTSLVERINKVIASGKSQGGMIKDFEQIFNQYSDVPTMARYALGVDGRSASAKQMRAFTKAFKGYISRKYGKRFREFVGGRIEVKSARRVKSFIEVKTTAFLKGQAPFEIKFLVSDKSGKTLFFNMFIEGINMLLTERTEIGAMLDHRGGNLNKMIEDLKRAG